MADLRDEHGNPIQLTDQFGKPVQLTDEYGNPMHLTGVATSPTARTGTAAEVAAKVAEELSHEQEPAPQPARPHVQQEHLAVPKKYSSSPLEHVNPTAGVLGTGAALKHYSQPPSAVPPLQPEQVRRSGSSGSSSSSEDDGQGGRRKKGSLKEKIMGAFGSHKDKGSHDHTVAATTTTHSKMSTTTVPEHEKKGFMEKIKEKLPGHHHDHQGKGTTN